MLNLDGFILSPITLAAIDLAGIPWLALDPRADLALPLLPCYSKLVILHKKFDDAYFL